MDFGTGNELVSDVHTLDSLDTGVFASQPHSVYIEHRLSVDSLGCSQNENDGALF